MPTFVSKKFKRPIIIIESEMKQRIDGETRKSKRIYFENYKFTTENQDEIDAIRNHPLFGDEYMEMQGGEQLPERADAVEVKVAGMSRPEDVIRAEFHEEMNNMREEMGNMTNNILQSVSSIVAEALKAHTKEKVPAPTDESKEEKKTKKKK